ncbi:MAG: hypothetical protein AAFR61_18680 [Bacteroidota bacterium]
MTQEERQAKVSAFFEGSLSAEERQSLLSGLEQDAALREEFELQEALLHGIQEKIVSEKYQQQRGVTFPLWRVVGVAASILLLGLVVIWWTNSGGTSPQDAREFAERTLADKDGFYEGGNKGPEDEKDSLAYWISTAAYQQTIDRLRPTALVMPDSGLLSNGLADSLYTLAVALAHQEEATGLEEASRLLDALISRAEDPYRRTWAYRQQIWVALRQGNDVRVRTLLENGASISPDPAFQSDLQQISALLP